MIFKTITWKLSTNSANLDICLGLSNIGKVTGDFFVVQNISTTLDLVVIPINYARF